MVRSSIYINSHQWAHLRVSQLKPCFYTVCVMALLKKHGLQPTQRSIMSVSRNVYVYGDDILVPTDDAAEVIDALHKYHCKVNTQKSYYRGFFRESCGCDAYAGVDVTPVYVRRMPPLTSGQDVQKLLSAISTSNQFHKIGFWRTADYLKTIVERWLGQLPCSETKSVAWQSFCGERYTGVRYLGTKRSCNRKQIRAAIERARVAYEYTGFLDRDRNVDAHALIWHVVPQTESDPLRGEHLLTKCLLALENRSPNALPLQDDHVRSVTRSSVALKRRWTPL